MTPGGRKRQAEARLRTAHGGGGAPRRTRTVRSSRWRVRLSLARAADMVAGGGQSWRRGGEAIVMRNDNPFILHAHPTRRPPRRSRHAAVRQRRSGAAAATTALAVYGGRRPPACPPPRLQICRARIRCCRARGPWHVLRTPAGTRVQRVARPAGARARPPFREARARACVLGRAGRALRCGGFLGGWAVARRGDAARAGGANRSPRRRRGSRAILPRQPRAGPRFRGLPAAVGVRAKDSARFRICGR